MMALVEEKTNFKGISPEAQEFGQQLSQFSKHVKYCKNEKGEV